MATPSVPLSSDATLGKRKDFAHESDDLDALESLTSSTTTHPASCKRRHVSHESTYQEQTLRELTELFGEKADAALIESVYDQCDEDAFKTIAKLVATTGLHPDLVKESRAHEDNEEEHKEAAAEGGGEKKEAQPDKPAFVSTSRARRHVLSSSCSSSPSPSCADIALSMRAAAVCVQRFVEFSGDLFACPATDALCHCISTDIAMGKGIAVQFKQRFGGVPELRAQQKAIGQVAVLRRDQRYVYYAITKAKYWNKPTYEALQRSLEDMKAHALAHAVSRISMPRIGCGLDGLLWPKVRDLLHRVFSDTPITISVYSRE